jgi:thiosulfate reductase cytochrome b subunit
MPGFRDEDKIVHSLWVRIFHWINAFAVFAMIGSGWRIYNASPIFGFTFPPEFTIGGWLAGALAWHFAVMWLFVGNILGYFIFGLLTGYFWRNPLSLPPIAAFRDLKIDLAILAAHTPGVYSPVQRALYVYVAVPLFIVIASGLAIWKPVQFQTLTNVLGGYDTARNLHFFAMVGLLPFLTVHIPLAFIFKTTLRSMITGKLRAPLRKPISKI